DRRGEADHHARCPMRHATMAHALTECESFAGDLSGGRWVLVEEDAPKVVAGSQLRVDEPAGVGELYGCSHERGCLARAAETPKTAALVVERVSHDLDEVGWFRDRERIVREFDRSLPLGVPHERAGEIREQPRPDIDGGAVRARS